MPLSYPTFTRARRGQKKKNAVAFASVSGTAAVVPPAEPLTEAVGYFSP
jgi:hypothetical protein